MALPLGAAVSWEAVPRRRLEALWSRMGLLGQRRSCVELPAATQLSLGAGLALCGPRSAVEVTILAHAVRRSAVGVVLGIFAGVVLGLLLVISMLFLRS